MKSDIAEKKMKKSQSFPACVQNQKVYMLFKIAKRKTH